MSITQPIVAVATEATDHLTDHLNAVQGAILGIVQGLTEFLPISSTAHLKVVPVMLGWGDPGAAFAAVIQLGSIVAVIWFFWTDLQDLVVGSWHAIGNKDWQSHHFRLTLGIALGTLPILVLGFLIKVFIKDYDNSILRGLPAIATVSIGMSLLLALAEKLGRRQKSFEDLDTGDGLIMGCAQCLALIPGVSRSGSTLTAGLFQGIERAAAARFSFLLGIPAITIAGLVELKSLLDSPLTAGDWVAVGMGFLFALIFSYLSIAWLLRYLQTQNTWIFVFYRLAFGVAIIAYLLHGGKA